MKLLSFGYKYGAPKEQDCVIFDICKFNSPDSFLWKKYNGMNKKLRKEIMDEKSYKDLVKSILFKAQSMQDKNSDLVIAIGCINGIHCSVAVAEYLYEHHRVYFDDLQHRDLNKKAKKLKQQKEYEIKRAQKYSPISDEF